MSDGYAKYCEDIERAGGWEAYHKKERERKEREARERKDEAISALIALIKKRVARRAQLAESRLVTTTARSR